MRGLKLPKVLDMHPNVTPLIDIVMCLIIFFMLVARIGVDAGDIQMNLPFSSYGRKIEDLGNTVTLNVEAGKVSMLGRDGRTLEEYKVPESDAGDLKARQNPSDKLRKVLESYRAENDKLKAIIRADENLAYQYLEPVYVICAQAKVSYNLAARDEN